jgi:hypothetical protein
MRAYLSTLRSSLGEPRIREPCSCEPYNEFDTQELFHSGTTTVEDN